MLGWRHLDTIRPSLLRSDGRESTTSINAPTPNEREDDGRLTPHVYALQPKRGESGPTFNDPTAGSPTVTLLRLLLPLNDKVQGTSHDVAGGEPPSSTRSEHFTGSFNR